MDIGLIASAFAAGIITFLAPCTLPLVPGYLGFVSGVSEADALSADMQTAKTARRKIFRNAVFFVVGFSLVFIIFGTLAGLFGAALAPYRLWLSRIGGVVVILFGLVMLGVLRIPALAKSARISLPGKLRLGTPTGSAAVGAAFAFGWTPCVGPILGSILLLASNTATAPNGALLLAVFSLGLAVPFLLTAALYAEAVRFIARAAALLRGVEIAGGVLLIFLGVLLATDNFGLVISWGYELFRAIGFAEYETFLLDRL